MGGILKIIHMKNKVTEQFEEGNNYNLA